MRAHCIVIRHVTHKDVAQVLLADHNNYGRGIPGESSRSGAPHTRSARVSVERSDDRECQASERVGQICRRNKCPDRGSNNEGVAPNHRPPSVGWQSIPPPALTTALLRGTKGARGP
jgi:hypothetical protein